MMCVLILNDRPDLARELGCDGVHIGQSDGTYAEARRAMGKDRLVGVTCHDSRHLAMEAAEAGADYVAFGAFFPTTTKEAPTRADPEILSIWQESMLIPCVAIGGITVENCRPLVAAGADFLAVSAGVWGYAEGPAAAVRAFNAEIAAGMVERRAVLSDFLYQHEPHEPHETHFGFRIHGGDSDSGDVGWARPWKLGGRTIRRRSCAALAVGARMVNRYAGFWL